MALERLRELVGNQDASASRFAGAGVHGATLAAELGRTERSIRAAIARGELQAVSAAAGM